ncbi:hypothetical protein IMCC3317_07260 [Kordia antarctica]|uniref:Uncharacterized protein n=1 Tax=Kordia antarctica TaxID=1218801 RepID=A0A7L4ZFW7_9FLAO|nr:hypothetical protein [Kordia antarctica]QHI35380.1 hypothetical protein IMCC3317_07260 [Kordia antarctica]
MSMSDYKTPNEKLITSQQASELNACYKEKQHSVFGTENDHDSCCSNWYSLEDLEGYINYVKQNALEKKINVDGIRFYFGVYPENMKDKSKAGQNTLFMCPTKASSELSRDEEANSEDVTEIPAMNLGDQGNPPQNIYGK